MTNKRQTNKTVCKPKFSEWLGGRLLKNGSHSEGQIREGEFCALEAVCLYLDAPELSDSPAHLGGLDIRILNDARWSSDAVRTEHLARVVDAWAGKKLTQKRAKKIALETVRRILPVVLRAVGLSEHAERCEKVRDVKSAEAAAEEAARAAEPARAAWAARAAAADDILILACDIFVEAVSG